MIKTEQVEITLFKGYEHYENLGYDIHKRITNKNGLRYPSGTKLKVHIQDLLPTTSVLVDVVCDYCGKEYVADYKYIIKGRNNFTPKDACEDCRYIKQAETNFKIYGVETPILLTTSRKNNRNVLMKSFAEIDKLFEARGCKLLTEEKDYKNTRDTLLKYVCPNNPNDIQTTTYASYSISKYCCKLCATKINTEAMRGLLGSNWQGGRTKIKNGVRNLLKQWQKDSMKNCSYKCVITGDKFDVVHHLYSFHNILDEIIKNFECGKSYSNMTFSDLSESELKLLNDIILEVHYKYPLGVCLRKDVHKLFHSIYGTHNNTPEQFYEFKSKIESGEIKLDKVA